MRRVIAAATTSRGARSSSGCTPAITRTPAASYRIAPSPRTASLTRVCWPRAPGPRHITVGWNWTNSTSVTESPAAQRDGQAVTGDGGRVRRAREHLAVAAGRDHDGAGGDDADRQDLPLGVDVGDANTRHLRLAGSRTAHHEIERERPAQHLHTGTERRLVERALHLGAALVTTRVDDAAMAVATLAGQRDVAALARVERGTEPHQVADRLRRLLDELAHDGFVAQPGAGGERVADVVLERVVRRQHARQATLGPRRAARRQDVLGDDEHAAHRSCREGSGQAGRARAEHDDVDVALHVGAGAAKRIGNITHGDIIITGSTTGGSAARCSRTTVTRRSVMGCRSRSSARPTGGRARRCRAARRRRRCRRAAIAAAWRE